MTVAALRRVSPTPLSRSLPRLESFVSPYVGVVRGLVRFARATDESALVGYGAVASDVIGDARERPSGTSGGSNWVPDAARAAAIGESLERYASSFRPADALVHATAEELGPEAVDPASFALFHERQHAADGFPFAPFDEHTPVAWVRGSALPSCAPCWVPAQLVFLPVVRDSQAEVPIGYATSSGVACAPTAEEAILTALYELVERDAFMLAWTNRLSLPLLDWSGDARLRVLDRRYFARTGLRYAAVDLSCFFGIPAMLGVVHGAPGRLGALGVGAGAGATVETAWRKALTEAFDVHAHVRDALVGEPELAGRPAAEIGSFDDHIFFYGHPARAERAAFLDASPHRRPTAEVAPIGATDVRAEIETVVARLAARGVSAYAVDVTTPDVRDAGLSVVRVVCPQLCALDVVHRARFLGGTRLARAAFEAGVAPAPFELDDLNPDPHPFP